MQTSMQPDVTAVLMSFNKVKNAISLRTRLLTVHANALFLFTRTTLHSEAVYVRPVKCVMESLLMRGHIQDQYNLSVLEQLGEKKV